MSERQACSQSPSQHPHLREVAPTEDPILDLEDLRSRAGGDESLVIELLEDFLERGVSFREIRAVADTKNYGELSLLTHRLRGALLALGATCAARAAESVEFHADALVSETPSNDLSALTTALAALDSGLANAVVAMRATVNQSVTPVTLSRSSA